MIPGLMDGLAPFLFSGTLLIATLGVLFGLIIGAIPGLGPVTALALGIPITFGMAPVDGMTFLLACYVGSVSGGAVSSILLNIPGTTGSIPTCFDGFPLAQQGRGREALAIGMVSSGIGAFGGAVLFLFLGPLMGRISGLLAPADYTAFIIVAFVLVAVGSREDGIKGLVMAGAGLLIAFVGRDPTTATPRFTGGALLLQDGIPFVAATLGLYAMSQVVKFAAEKGTIAEAGSVGGSLWDGVVNTVRAPFVIVRSWLLGGVVGVLPGIGITLSGLLGWVTQRRLDKEPLTFGKGNPRGVVSTEVANNSTATASLSTTFALGIPGGATDAILLGGLLLYGLRPGSSFFAPAGDPLFFPMLAWGLLIAPLLVVASIFLLGPLTRLTQVPMHVLVPVIGVLSVLGAFSTRNQLFDVWVMMAFGVVGYFLEKARYPVQNLVIGMVLGTVLEQNLNRALIISQGSLDVFWERPIARTALLIGAVMLLGAFVNIRALIERFDRRGPRQGQKEPSTDD